MEQLTPPLRGLVRDVWGITTPCTSGLCSPRLSLHHPGAAAEIHPAAPPSRLRKIIAKADDCDNKLIKQ